MENRYEKHDTLDIQMQVISKLLDKYSDHNVIRTTAYFDISTINLSIDLFEKFRVNLVQLKHVYSGANTSDVNIIIDVIKTLCDPNNNIDKYVIASSDSDMIPLINEFRRYGKEFEIHYIDTNTNHDYQKYLTATNSVFFKIEDLLGLPTFKEKDDTKLAGEQNIRYILNHLNTHINQKYLDHIRKNGNTIEWAGAATKSSLREYFLNSKAFVKDDISKGFIIDALFSKGFVYEYAVPNSQFKALLIRPQFLIDNGISMQGIKTESDFQFPIAH